MTVPSPEAPRPGPFVPASQYIPVSPAGPGFEPPTAPIPPVAAAPPPPRKSRFAIAVAFVALLLALTSSVLAIYAIGIANGARDAQGQPAAQGRTPAPGAAPTVAAPNPPQSAAAAPSFAVPTARPSAGELDPKASFTEAYTPSTQTLTIHPPNGYGNREIDLDRPQVDQGASDLTVSFGSDGSMTFRFPNGVRGAQAADQNVQPSDCADLIQRGALSHDTPVPVGTPNLTLCVTTSFDEAKTQGISWKMVVVHVASIGNDRTVQLSVKAWNIPDN
jgi:hypothetical protein